MSLPNIAWGSKLSADSKAKIIEICNYLEINPNWLMACMAFESGETFSPSVRNAAGSNAVGLIQFMPATCIALGITSEMMGGLSIIEQLEYVQKYFKAFKGRMKSLSDVYMAILWPVAVGKPEDHVLFRKDDANHPKRYLQNKGLDFNSDGVITKRECAGKVELKLIKGLRAENFG